MENNQFFSQLIKKGELRVNKKGHAILSGEYLFLIPPKVIVKLQNNLKEELGHEKMKDMMESLGKYQVKQAMKRYKDKYNLNEISKGAIFKKFKNYTKILGWGNIEFEEMDRKNEELIVTVNHPTLPKVYLRSNKESDIPVCHYLNGMIEEIGKAMIDNKIEVEEKKCVAKGDEICLFISKD